MTTRKLIPDLLPKTKYAIQVRAVGPTQVSEWSRLYEFTTITDIINPATPTGVTWASVGDTFHGEWSNITLNEEGEEIAVTRYEIELVANSVTKIDSVTPASGASKVTYDLTFEMNRALFGTPQPSITFRVRAVDNKDLKSNWSTPAITAANAVPAAPTAPAVGTVATAGVDSIALAWTAPSDNDIIGYNVYVGSTAGFTPAPANRIYSGLSTRFTYTTTTYTLQYFKIRSVDRFGQESVDLTANATANSSFTIDNTAPAVPTSLAAAITNNANGLGARAAVTWAMASPPADLSGFYLRWRKVGDTNYSSTTFDKEARAGTVELQSAFTNYEFQIRSYDWANNYSAYSTTVTSTSPANGVPSNVTGLTSTAGRESIAYSWTAVTDADLKEYEVTFSTSSTFVSGNVTFRTGTASSLAVSGLTPATTYYARVRAVDNSNAASAAWSATDTKATLAQITAGEIGAAGPSEISALTSAVNSKNNVTYSVNPPGTAANTAGDTWFVRANDASPITAQYEGKGGTAWVLKTLDNATIANLDAGKISSGFIAGARIQAGTITAASGIIADAAITSAKINDVSAAKITAGTVGNGVGITMAAGSSILLNGGHLRSNTYNGGTAYSGTATTGFYLGDDGLRIGSGSISASTLTAGTISGTNTIALSGAGAKITGTGFELSGTGLSVTSGTISAAALQIQAGQNIMPPLYADFEGVPETYPVFPMVTGTAIRGVNATGGKIGVQKFGAVWSSQATVVSIAMGSGVTDYNIPLEEGKTYIVSGYAWSGQARNSTLKMKYSNGTTITVATGTTAANDTAAAAIRQSGVITVPVGVTGGLLIWESTTINLAGGVSLDGFQVEEKLAALNTPSTWTSPVSTRIDGGMIRTGEIRSSAIAQVWDDTLNSGVGGYKVDPDNQPAWSIGLAGVATFRNTQVLGSMVVGNQSDAGLVDTSKMSTLSSATYVPGDTGWSLRADGQAEFLNVRANSFDGSAIRAGTVHAEALTSGTISSDITLAGSFETASEPTQIRVKTTNASTTLTSHADDPVFTSSDVGITIAGFGIRSDTKIAAYVNAHQVTLSLAATSTTPAGDNYADARMYRGRTVRMSGEEGIVLSDQYQNVLVSLPTNPNEVNRFAGSVVATDLFVRDEFRMFGVNNSLGQGSTLELEGGNYIPGAAPSVAFSWSNVGLKTLDGTPYVPGNDPYSTYTNGFKYDPLSMEYFYCSNFFGAYLEQLDGPDSGGSEGTRSFAIPLKNAMRKRSNDWALGGWTRNPANDYWYFLTRHSADVTWWVQGFTGNGIFRSGGPVAPADNIGGDRISQQPWYAPDVALQGMNGYPKIDYFNGATYIAKMTSANKIAIFKYTGLNVNAPYAKATVSGQVVSGSIASVSVGNFDYGAGTYVLVTVAGVNTAHRQTFVFFEGTTDFTRYGFEFPTPYDASASIGTTWVGTSTSDSTGYFKTLTGHGYIYTHTGLGRTTFQSSVKAYQRWRNNGSGGGTIGIGPAGPSSSYVPKRRSKMSVTSTTAIPNTGGNSPNAVTFYLSTDGVNYLRYDEGGTGVIQMTYTDFRTTNASGTSAALVGGTPAKIQAAGLEINGNGTITTSGAISAASLTTTGNVLSANLPARMISGTTSVSLNNSITGAASVTFPAGFFTSTVRMTAVSVGTSVYSAYLNSAPSTAGVQVGLRKIDGNPITGTGTVSWIAIQD